MNRAAGLFATNALEVLCVLIFVCFVAMLAGVIR
jgi:hypothetical protein